MILIGAMCFTCLNAPVLLAQDVFDYNDYDYDGHQDGAEYGEVLYNGWPVGWWWTGPNGELYSDDHQPVPWPPEFPDIDGDHDEDGDHDGGHHDGDGYYEDNDDFWDEYWQDPWEGWEWYDDDTQAGGGPNIKPCPRLESRTFKLPNRRRTTVGIGEQLEIRIRNLCDATTTWTIKGPGKIETIISNKECRIRALWEEGNITIKATLSNMNGDCAACANVLELKIKVIKPTGIFFDNNNIANQDSFPSTIRHRQYRPSGGYFSTNYLMPDSVNFYSLKIKEGYAESDAVGAYFDGIPGPGPHISNDFVGATDYVIKKKGTRIIKPDMIRVSLLCRNERDPVLYGNVVWPIKTYYASKETNQIIDSIIVYQRATNSGGRANAEFLVGKANSGNKTLLEDPDAFWWPSVEAVLAQEPECD